MYISLLSFHINLLAELDDRGGFGIDVRTYGAHPRDADIVGNMASTEVRNDRQNESSHPKNSITWTNTGWTRKWSHLNLDKATVLQMLKGGLPPVIVISL